MHSESTCLVEGCTSPVRVILRQLCNRHYHSWKKYGKPENPPKPTVAERFWSQVNKTDDCWLWTGGKNANGYGRCWNGTRLIGAHQWSYVQVNGPVPRGLELDHLCRNPPCVRPEHLEAVTHGENMRRGMGIMAINRTRRAAQYCARGHEFTAENTYWRNDYRREGGTLRVCKACNRLRQTWRRPSSP